MPPRRTYYFRLHRKCMEHFARACFPAFAGWSWMAFAESRRATKFGAKVSCSPTFAAPICKFWTEMQCNNIDRPRRSKEKPLQPANQPFVRSSLARLPVLALAAVIEFVHQKASSSSIAKCALHCQEMGIGLPYFKDIHWLAQSCLYCAIELRTV